MPKLDFPAGRRGGPSPSIVNEDLVDVAQRLLSDPKISGRDRIAAILVAVFANRSA